MRVPLGLLLARGVSRMKVAQLLNPLEHIAGIERFVLETSREMSIRGIETRIYTASCNAKLRSDLQREVEIEKVDLVSIPLLQIYSNLSVSKHLIDIASSWADVILLHSGLGIADHSWRRHNLPCFPIFHIDKYDPKLYGSFRALASIYTYPLRLQESKCIRNIPLAFANSSSLADRVRHYSQARELIVIPLGVNVEQFRPTWNDAHYVLMAGRYHPANNFELGLKVAALAGCKIVVTGICEKKFLWYYQHLRELVADSQLLRDKVEFLNRSDDSELVHLLQNCSVFLSPRKYDYLGLAALEAMACGKPVIAYNAEEGSEYSPAIKCGDHFSMWQETLETLMGDRRLRDKVGRASRQFIEERHTWKKTVDLMLSKIEDLRHDG